MIKDIHQSKLCIRYRKIPLHKVGYIRIDELSIRRGHEYMIVDTDLRTGRILQAVKAKSKGGITPVLNKLVRVGNRLEGVAMEMSSAHYHPARESLPMQK